MSKLYIGKTQNSEGSSMSSCWTENLESGFTSGSFEFVSIPLVQAKEIGVSQEKSIYALYAEQSGSEEDTNLSDIADHFGLELKSADGNDWIADDDWKDGDQDMYVVWDGGLYDKGEEANPVWDGGETSFSHYDGSNWKREYVLEYVEAEIVESLGNIGGGHPGDWLYGYIAKDESGQLWAIAENQGYAGPDSAFKIDSTDMTVDDIFERMQDLC